ncbi:hypothetical protein UlMin_022455 [Ulmus minor]
MVFIDLFVGEIVTELLKQLVTISWKSCLCKSSTDSLIAYLNQLIPLIEEVKYSGVEMSALRQSELNRFSETFRKGLKLTQKVLASARWNVYKNLMLARKMEKLEEKISRFIQGPMYIHFWANVHHLRFENIEQLDRLEGRLEQWLGELKIGFMNSYQTELFPISDEEVRSSFFLFFFSRKSNNLKKKKTTTWLHLIRPIPELTGI